MKMQIIFLAVLAAMQLNAMEPEEPILSAEEIEQLWQEQEDIERIERYKRPWKEETPEEKQANLEQQLAFLKSKAAFDELPEELKTHILSFLVSVPGEDKATQLQQAATNIRAFLLQPNRALNRLLNDEAINGYLIQELADRYIDGDLVTAALALHTKAGGQWLKKHIITPDNILSANYHLMFAIDAKNIRTINFLLQALPESILFEEQLTAPLELKIRYGQQYLRGTWLIYAVHRGNVEIVKKLIKAGLPLDARDDADQTALMIAAWEGNLEIVKILLEAGAQIDLATNDGSTALSLAIESGEIDTVKELIDRGAKLIDRNGYNPLHEAAQLDFTDLIQFLLSHGIDVNKGTNERQTALMLAIIHYCDDFFNELLTVPGIQFNLQDVYGRTAMHYTITDNCIDGIEEQIVFLKKLLAAGANPNIKDLNGKTPLDYAEALEAYIPEDAEQKEILIQLLKSYGAKRGSEL